MRIAVPGGRRALSWALYDWANSAFATTVMAGFFPLFFKAYWNAGVDAQVSTFRLGAINSAASLAVALSAPLLGAFADRQRRRRFFVISFTILGAGATGGLALLGPEHWFIAALAYGTALYGFYAAIVFYDSFLPDVAEGENAARISSLGYAAGYLGGGLLFFLNVVMYSYPEFFGLSDPPAAVKASFLSVSVWWVVFSLPMFLFVREQKREQDERAGAAFKASVLQLRNSFRFILSNRSLACFLAAYWFYIDGVNTVIKMAVDYGAALGFGHQALIAALLLVQFVGFPSTIVFGWIAGRIGARPSVFAGIVVYALATCWAVQMSAVWEFYVLAGVIGLVQGGVQAISRSIYAGMIPAQESAQFFGLFDIVGKFATIIGPLLVGAAAVIFDSSRAGVLSLILVFLLGGALLYYSGKQSTGSPSGPASV